MVTVLPLRSQTRFAPRHHHHSISLCPSCRHKHQRVSFPQFIPFPDLRAWIIAGMTYLRYVSFKYCLIPTFVNGSVSLQPHPAISLTLPEDLEWAVGTSPRFYGRKDKIGGWKWHWNASLTWTQWVSDIPLYLSWIVALRIVRIPCNLNLSRFCVDGKTPYVPELFPSHSCEW